MSLEHTIIDRMAVWQQWADGYLSCPVCGAIVHPTHKETHILWHPFTDRFGFDRKESNQDGASK